jgi:predicted branched-subunit amino acid permease
MTCAIATPPVEARLDRSRAADREAVVAGARAMLPFLLAVAPFGLAVGVAVADSGLPHVAGWSLGWLVYAGSAQLAAVGLLAGDAPVVTVVFAVTVVNLRLSLYSAALAPHWRSTPVWWRAVAAYLVVDPSFVVGSRSYDGSRTRRAAHLHYLGGAALLWVGWQGVIAVGVTAGALLPGWLQLGAVGPLYLVTIVVAESRRPGATPAAVAALAGAAAGSALPLHLGPALGILTGLLVGSRTMRGRP